MAARWIKSERLARIILVLMVLGIPIGIILWGRNTILPGIKVRAAVPENGGWMPGTIQAEVGKPLTMQFTSEDVVHGFAIGQLDHPEIEVIPGKISQTTITFPEPGRYVYYCTRWCSPNHWRMRGTIVVSGNTSEPPRSTSPLYVDMGIDLNEERSTDNSPSGIPSIQNGQIHKSEIEGAALDPYRTVNYLRTYSPSDVWQSLRGESFTQELTDDEIWDLIAALWQSGTTSEYISTGEQLYSQNCAACHGINGDGEGIFALQDNMEEIEPNPLLSDLTPPADFTNSEQMLATSSALLQGKIIRGGMGTGMPNFGPILTEEQIWAVVDYIWTFQFTD